MKLYYQEFEVKLSKEEEEKVMFIDFLLSFFQCIEHAKKTFNNKKPSSIGNIMFVYHEMKEIGIPEEFIQNKEIAHFLQIIGDVYKQIPLKEFKNE